jgi:hypothetical protein
MSQSTELAGFIQPQVFTDYVMEQSVIKNGLINSGIITVDPVVAAVLLQGGAVSSTLTYPNIDVGSSANVTSSNQGSSATPKLLTGRAQKFPRIGRNDSWASADWNVSMLGSDPAAFVGGNVVSAVNKWRQLSLNKVLVGATGATNGNLTDISVAAIANYGDATQINTDTVTDFIVNTYGDFASADRFSAAIAMHSKTYGFLAKNDFTAFTRFIRADARLHPVPRHAGYCRRHAASRCWWYGRLRLHDLRAPRWWSSLRRERSEERNRCFPRRTRG